MAVGRQPVHEGDHVAVDAAALDRVVGIGSSAGGLEALQFVLPGLVAGTGMAYIVAQHVSPQHRSLMAELLAKQTALTVKVAADGETMQPDHIYVTPPNADVTVVGARIQLSTPPAGHGPKPSIDGLFLSLADQWSNRAVAILLSGTGDDGTYGMREIKASGGLAIAQEPETAKYEAMPLAAIRAGVVDLVLSPSAMGAAVAHAALGTQDDRDPELGTTFLHKVLEQVRLSGAGNFNQYKQGTLLRQIARRMAVLQLTDESDYVTYLTTSATESRLLRQSILVSVTSFRRDPAAWDGLREVLTQRWAEEGQDRQFRIWVPGCATGEEACTVAMLVDEVLGHPIDLADRVKIFATDLDEVALDFARRATYPQQAVARLPKRWQEEYFVPKASALEVTSRLRDAMIFARHDITADPAFVRLDLVSFRNVLIYFESALQNQVLGSMHFALRPGGLLFLGKSDGLASMGEWFGPVSAKHRIYQRIAGRAGASEVGRLDNRPKPVTLRSYPVRHDNAASVRESLLRTVVPSALIVDDGDRVVEVLGDVGPFVAIRPGHFDDRVGSLLSEELRSDVRRLIVQARATGHPVSTVVSHGERSVTLRAIPLVAVAGTHVAVLLNEAPNEEVGEQDSSTLSRVRAELANTREALQATIEELETSNEELQATNEEMTASSEELQASNEELETINEELQATNEELASLNEELQVRQQELVLVNEDLQNILNAVAHAIVILDMNLRVTRYSPLAVRVFALVESDIGRVITGVPATVPTTHLETTIREVIATGDRGVLELHGDSRRHQVHVVPYRGTEGAIKGAILSITDVTDSAPNGDPAVDAELSLLRAMTEGLDEIVWRRGADGSVTFINAAVQDLFGLTQDQAMAEPEALDLGVAEADLAQIGSLASENRPRYLRYRVSVPGRDDVEVEDVIHQVHKDANGERVTIGSIRRRQARDPLQTVDEGNAVEALLSLPRDLVLVIDLKGSILKAGEISAQMLGVAAEDLVGRNLMTYVHDQDVGALHRILAAGAADESAIQHARLRMIARGGGLRWVDLSARQLQSDAATCVVTITDITDERERSQDLGRRMLFDAGTGLFNRTSFIDALRMELGRHQGRVVRTAVLWIDLDGFKEVNDQYGHAVGDSVLREVASRLQTACRSHDRVGRLGGDEFGVLVAELEHVSEVEAIAARIVESVAMPIEVRDTTVTVGASVGVAIGPQDGESAEDLLNAADAAMYAAKRSTGNRFQYYTTGLNEQAARRALLRQQLAEGIRHGAFVAYYQPIRHIAGQIWGFEALVRWKRGDEVVAAGEFIRIAEETGQIQLIGRQVLKQVLGDMPSIVEMSPQAKVTINLSVPELEDPATLRTILLDAPSGLLGNLAIEITESALLAEDSQALGAITVLARRGVAICLDDFGTGFANFTAVDRLGPHVIKADRSMIDRAESGNPRAQSLLRAVVALSDAVGSEALAEGISSPAHLEAARAAGMSLAQGYHLGRPMPMEALREYVRDVQG